MQVWDNPNYPVTLKPENKPSLTLLVGGITDISKSMSANGGKMPANGGSINFM